MLKNKFDRIVLVINPQSSNIQRIQGRAAELGKLFPHIQIEIVETTINKASFGRTLLKIFGSKSERILLGIGGGDGTVHLVANIMMLANPKLELDNIILLPLWGGNANDFAYMLNGLSARARLKSVMNNASIVAIHPLEVITTSTTEKESVCYAVCYASFGASAYTTDQLDKPIPEKRILGKPIPAGILNEFRRVARALLDAPGFDAEQDGREVKMFEQLFSNGSRMAKVDRLPVSLTAKQFYYAVRSDKRPTISFYVLRLLRGKKLGEIRQKPVHFTIRERAWAQFDGEARVIPEYTAIAVGHSKRPLYALSTKLGSKSN